MKVRLYVTEIRRHETVVDMTEDEFKEMLDKQDNEEWVGQFSEEVGNFMSHETVDEQDWDDGYIEKANMYD